MCKHRWVIEMPNGPQSLGTCKHCGETRYFGNVVDDVMTESAKKSYGRGHQFFAGPELGYAYYGRW